MPIHWTTRCVLFVWLFCVLCSVVFFFCFVLFALVATCTPFFIYFTLCIQCDLSFVSPLNLNTLASDSKQLGGRDRQRERKTETGRDRERQRETGRQTYARKQLSALHAHHRDPPRNPRTSTRPSSSRRCFAVAVSFRLAMVSRRGATFRHAGPRARACVCVCVCVCVIVSFWGFAFRLLIAFSYPGF